MMSPLFLFLTESLGPLDTPVLNTGFWVHFPWGQWFPEAVGFLLFPELSLSKITSPYLVFLLSGCFQSCEDVSRKCKLILLA